MRRMLTSSPYRPRKVLIVFMEEIEVHPGFHNKNLLTFLNGGLIALAGRHAKVRRDGYKAWAANP
jgi:hypothetical protein